MSVLLISTYDMGRQPFGLASPAAWLRAAGVDVVCADLAKERLSHDAVRSASVVGFFLPMHTATRLALPVIDKVRRMNPAARLVAYGLYAPLNEALLRERGVDDVLGGEFEKALLEVAVECAGSAEGARTAESAERARKAERAKQAVYSATPGVDAPAPRLEIPRLKFLVPLREGLPPLEKYASLQHGAERRIAGYTEASRGCKHRCRHCPIVPVYDGRFRIIPVDIVIADARAQVAAGAQHITFGDPDFFNGIRHARDVIARFAQECPDVTYDVTIKVEHLIQHADALPLLRETGCAFVTSAVESLDDNVLERLEKGHTRQDFERVVSVCRDAGVPLSPTFVAFTPWTSIEGYLELLHEIDRLNLVDHVAPIQYAIRLLVPQGSRMLELEEVARIAGRFDPLSLTHPWRHSDPRVDGLQELMSRVVGVRMNAPRREVFERVWIAAHTFAMSAAPERTHPITARATVPYLNEPWYC